MKSNMRICPQCGTETTALTCRNDGFGTVDAGRHIRYERETPLCNLFMAMLDRMGASPDYIGDSTGSLSGLSI